MQPIKIVLRIIVVVALAEVVSMTVLPYIGVSGGGQYVVLDTALLVLLSAPFIHLWVVNGAVRDSSLGWALSRSALEREEAMRHRAEDSERHLRDLVQGLDAIVYEADPSTGRFSFVSERAEAILGYPARSWLADPAFWAGMLHPDDRSGAETQRGSALALGKDVTLAYRAVAADGKVLEFQDAMRVVRDPDGRPRKVVGLITRLAA